MRAGIYWGRESWVLGFAVRPGLMALAEKQALRHLAKQVPDPAHMRIGPDRLGGSL